MSLFRRFVGCCALTFCAVLALRAAEPEFHARHGLPHLRALIAAGRELRVAYLGGSITAAADGWRTLTTNYLQKTYPLVSVVEISAGLPGTGSNLGACRIGSDVLQHHPDLLFVEFAVNDTGAPRERIEATMEGIVRQALRANPEMDIWFVYTVSLPALSDLEDGRYQPSAVAMERVAEHYGIPSLHFGIEIARRVQDGKLLFKPAVASAPGPAGPLIPVQATAGTSTPLPMFSLDGVHPTAEGHRLYFEAIARHLPDVIHASANSLFTAAMPAPLRADNWEYAEVRRMDDVARQGEWQKVAGDDANLRGITKALLPPTWRTAVPGGAIEFEFRGRKFGLLGIGAPDSGEFRVTIDGGAAISDTFFDSYATPTFCRQREWFYPRDLDDTVHRVRVELLDTVIDKLAIKAKGGRPASDPEPYQLNRLTLCGVLVVGSKPR